MRLTRCYPKIKNRELITEYFKKNEGEEAKPAMFVANHCSWMDIPFLGAVMGWRNYKIVSKKELGVVPILGTALYAGGHIMVDRVDRRSQIKTLKQGINYLKDVSFFFAASFSCMSLCFEEQPVLQIPIIDDFEYIELTIFYQNFWYLFIRTNSSLPLSQRELDLRRAACRNSRPEPSRWLTRQEPRYFLFRSRTQIKSCP